MRSLLLIIGSCLCLLAATSADSKRAGTITLSGSGSFQLSANGEGCMMLHRSGEDVDETSVQLSNAAETSGPASRSFRLVVGENKYGPSNEMTIFFDEQSFSALSPSGIISIRAEKEFDDLTDDEYMALQEESEEADGQSHPSFDSFQASVGDQTFAEYAATVRASERFPATRVATVSISISDVPVIEAKSEIDYEFASFVYEGSCDIGFMNGRN